ncbi:MAG TPA: ribonuclease HII [Candidatus Diapherotrites archaeon]|nr:ribonuclease HII [Candidatus Diapherotrites archaeon]
MTKQLVAGFDEAGRGCVLGPLVLAVCVIDKNKEKMFKDAGVKDSKLLSSKQREELFELIKKEAEEYKIVVVPAEELNILMDRFSLNEIEAQKAAFAISKLKSTPLYLVFDSPDTTTTKFTKRIKDNLKAINHEYNYKIISEHKADLNHPSVSCASILAKVTRDEMLKKLVGLDISGYSSDPKTIDFLKDYFKKHKSFPEYTRMKWKTVDNIVNELYQKKLL